MTWPWWGVFWLAMLLTIAVGTFALLWLILTLVSELTRSFWDNITRRPRK